METTEPFLTPQSEAARLAKMLREKRGDKYTILSLLNSDAEAIATELERGADAIEAQLIAPGAFVGNSGAVLPWKIECDALTDATIAGFAAAIAQTVRFGEVEGVPRGGLRLAKALEAYATDGPLLIVDDVCIACWECGQPAPSGVCAGPHPNYRHRETMAGNVMALDRDPPLCYAGSSRTSPVIPPVMAKGWCPECGHGLTYDELGNWCERCVLVPELVEANR